MTEQKTPSRMAVAQAEDDRFLVQQWVEAHALHNSVSCDCNDGFGGCSHLSCWECGQEWPCESILLNLEAVDAAEYWRFFDLWFEATERLNPLPESVQSPPSSPIRSVTE